MHPDIWLTFLSSLKGQKKVGCVFVPWARCPRVVWAPDPDSPKCPDLLSRGIASIRKMSDLFLLSAQALPADQLQCWGGTLCDTRAWEGQWDVGAVWPSHATDKRRWFETGGGMSLGPGPTIGIQPRLASRPAPPAPGQASQPPCCPLAWPSSHLDWSVCISCQT